MKQSIKKVLKYTFRFLVAVFVLSLIILIIALIICEPVKFSYIAGPILAISTAANLTAFLLKMSNDVCEDSGNLDDYAEEEISIEVKYPQ